MENQRKLILYIAISLDGYIAGPEDDLSFLSIVDQEGEDYGYSKFIQTIDTIIMGRKTFDIVMKMVEVFPHGDKACYIITKNPKPDAGKVRFYAGDLKELILKLKNKPGKDIFCDGGAEIVNALLEEKLFDELIISIIPVLLGTGKRLFCREYPFQNLKLVESKSFKSGLAQLKYKIDESKFQKDIK